jgi:hypothetical protein
LLTHGRQSQQLLHTLDVGELVSCNRAFSQSKGAAGSGTFY